jgi:HAD superfamily hydrolase (TIGR01490 family)
VKYLRRNDQMTLPQLLQSIAWLVQYRFGLLDFDAMTRKLVVRYRGAVVDDLREEVRRWYATDVRPFIATQARERVARHREDGHEVVLLTSATRFLSVPLAEDLEIPHILCTEVAEEEGRLTGRIIPPPCYGDGKVVHAERFAREHDVDLDRSFFYTDSYTDLPMLERVGEPRVVNPDPRLRRFAVARGWGFETWEDHA